MNKETKKFIEDLKSIRDYWTDIAEQNGYDTKQTCESFLFSILSYIDGCAALNDFHTILLTDAESGRQIGSETMLHEHYYENTDEPAAHSEEDK